MGWYSSMPTLALLTDSFWFSHDSAVKFTLKLAVQNLVSMILVIFEFNNCLKVQGWAPSVPVIPALLPHLKIEASL